MHLPPQQDHLHRSELRRPRQGIRRGDPQGANSLFQKHDLAHGSERSADHPARIRKNRLGSELAIVISKKALYVSEADALNYVAGYALHNDYSERAWQLERGGQWVKGKSCDSFAPLGPFLATKDEIPHPNDLKLWLKVNGTQRQNSTTAQMIFHIPFLVSYISQFMTLLPGDVISTGTPPGVGLGFKPPIFLVPGDVVELGIEGLGESRQVAQAAG